MSDDSESLRTGGVVVASDLDRTLIYSARAFWLDTPDDEAPAIVVSEIYQGSPLSFMTRAAEAGLRALMAESTFVPVTTRTTAQYRRVRLPGPMPDYAVTANGGVILHRGLPDAAWRHDIARRSESVCAPLAELVALTGSDWLSPGILRVHTAEELFVYAIVDRDVLSAEQLEHLTAECTARGWVVSLQGRKLYCVPAPITKEAAVAEIARRVGATTVLAAGDSLLDRGMLAHATLAFRPHHGELDDAGYDAPHLTVTRARGLLAGEELVGLLRAAAAASARAAAAPVFP